jgi:hypothetical protein
VTQPRLRTSLVLLLALLAVDGCERRDLAAQASPPSAVGASTAHDAPVRDLSVDESMGGHTLARHVGKTDRELLDRLAREPQISAASTYTDRNTAEQVIGVALASADRKIDKWRRRTGRRPNLVLTYNDRQPLGRSMARGQTESTPCDRALVVLRWDDRRERFYVLTSYPEADR